MQRSLTSLIQACACCALLLGVAARAQDKKVDPTGTWTWSMAGRNGGEPRKFTLKLKLEGDKLTGNLASPGRQGGAARESAIEEAKLSGDAISFQVTREFQGNKFVSKYTGKLSADAIKGKIETERDGQAQSRDWEAKREVAKAKE